MALTNPEPGKEPEFNAWYDQHHLREVVEYGSGMVRGRRYRLSDEQRPGQEAPPWRYLALYDLECDDVADYHRGPWIVDRPPLVPFQGLVRPDHAAWIYTPMGPRISRPGRQDDGGDDRAERPLFLALTNAAAGQDEAFNAWYDQHHLREVVDRLPGFIAGQRYRLNAHQRPGQPRSPWEYLAVYELERDRGIHQAAAEEMRRSPMVMPQAGVLDPRHLAWVYAPTGAFQEKA